MTIEEQKIMGLLRILYPQIDFETQLDFATLADKITPFTLEDYQRSINFWYETYFGNTSANKEARKMIEHIVFCDMSSDKSKNKRRKDRAPFLRFVELIYKDLGKAVTYAKEHPEILHVTDGIGETPFHYVVVENYLEAAKVLLELGSDINTCTELGERPVHAAAISGHTEMMCWLLDKGANPNVVDECGYSPLSHAIEHDYSEIIEMLMLHISPDNVNSLFGELEADDIHKMPDCYIKRQLLDLGLRKPNWDD